MKRSHLDSPDEGAFLREVLRSVEGASSHDAKVQVLSKAFMTFRGWCYAWAALLLDEKNRTMEEAVTALFKGAGMYYPEGEWRRFGELLYPKEGPMMARVLEAAKKRKGEGA